MKDEIKEILEDVKRHLDYVEATKQTSIRDNEMKAMYDYINDLQDTLKDREEYCYALETQSTNLQQENEKLKHKLEQMYNDTKDTYNEICAEQIDYKSRNEKAIEIFKKAFDYRDNISVNNWEYDGGKEEYIEMLESAYNILQGSDE